uniref:cytochrome f n=1 Tax=Madagascaria erythrocladioides TaxID=753684 RepID=UPI001BEE9F4E|nr:cytochrome f [Madagascaria erythrocladioides]QUE29074.1 PetA [Madagascaria erythrocladioides]UNJ16630.1 cytochrome f [Madagascaria erythrocladioides]
MHLIKIVKNIYTCLTIFSLFLFIIVAAPQTSASFPIYAQQAYENPREATGKIVCANCHLAQKPVSIEVPKSVLPNTVFEAAVKVPYDTNLRQVIGSGQKAALNLGAVVVLPEGFKLAPNDRLDAELKEKTKGVYIQTYSTKYDNILVVGPMPSPKNNEIIFPVLSPDPNTDKSVHFIKYPIYVGGNRGRGQVYPSGDKTNNNAYLSLNTGKITSIESVEKGGYNINIVTPVGDEVTEKIPAGLELIVSQGQKVSLDQPLTKDPNVGGFGQTETEIVLQNPNRIKFLIGFFFSVVLTQVFLVLKKKQFEKVQASQMNF